MAARTLDPPRYLSVRPLERMNGKLTQQINSRSQPGENAANIVQTHYADTYNRVHHPLGNTNRCVTQSSQLKFAKVATKEMFYQCY